MARLRSVRQLEVVAAERIPAFNIHSIWHAFWAQPMSFKMTCVYVFFEYVRPQQIYTSLQILPWAKLSIAIACVAYVSEGFRIRARTMMNTWLVAFSALVILSSIFATYPEISFTKLTAYVNWMVAFFLVANTSTDQKRLFLFVTLFLLWSTKMSQHGARAFLASGGQAAGAPGWFQNTGEFALQMCIYVPLSLQFIVGLYPSLSTRMVALLALLPTSGVISIIGSGSRGGLLALGCVGLWMLLVSRRRLRGLVVLAVVAPMVWFFVPDYQKARLNTAGTDNTSIARITYWKAGMEMANEHPLLGVGFENWVPYYRDHYLGSGGIIRYGDRGQVIVEVSHNSFIEVLSQLGYPGLLIFLALLASIWVLNARTRRLLNVLDERARLLRHISHGLDAGVIGFMVAGFFMAVAFYPFVWFQLGMTAALHVAAQNLIRSTANERSPGMSDSRREAERGARRLPSRAAAGQFRNATLPQAS